MRLGCVFGAGGQLWGFLAPEHVADHRAAAVLLDRLATGAGGCPAGLVDTEVLGLLTAAKANTSAATLDRHISRFNIVWTLTGTRQTTQFSTQP